MLDPQPEQIAPQRFWPVAALAIGLGLAGQLVLAWHPEAFAEHPFRQPWVLAAVHLNSLGFLGLTFLAVALQAFSVLLHQPRTRAWPASLGPGAFALGVLGLVAFFARWRTAALLIPSLTALFAGYGWVAWQLGRDQRGQRLNTDAKRGSAQAFLALGAMILLGACMALGLIGHPMPMDPFAVLQWHIHLGLAGFAGLAIFGLLPKLLRLFQGAKGYATWPSKLAFSSIHAGLLVETAYAFDPAPWLSQVGAGLFLLAALAFSLQLALLLRAASKRKLDSSLSLQLWATAWLLTAAVLDLRFSLGGGLRIAMAAVYAALFGWVGGMILGSLQRIGAVLAWFQRFYDVSTQQAVPTAWELIHPALAWTILPLHAVASLCGLAGILGANPFLLRLSGFLGAAALAATLILIRLALKRGQARPF